MKKRRYSRYRLHMLNSGLAILAKNTIPEHTKRGVVAQVLFCESSQSVTTKTSIQKLSPRYYFKKTTRLHRPANFDELARVFSDKLSLLSNNYV